MTINVICPYCHKDHYIKLQYDLLVMKCKSCTKEFKTEVVIKVISEGVN